MAKLHKAATNFTQVSNRVLADVRLSWKAKGLYAYLYSKPDSWSFSSDRIKNDWSDGKDSVQAWLRELENVWYLSRKRLGNGSMSYFIGIEPQPENPVLEPQPGNPSEGIPLGGKIPPISNTEDIVINNTSNTESINASEDFEEFWKIYPRKESRKEAERKFSSLSKKDKGEAIQRLPLFVEFWNKSEIEQQFIPHPSTWINQRRWEDSLPDVKKRQKSGKHIPRNAMTEEKDYSAGLEQFSTVTH